MNLWCVVEEVVLVIVACERLEVLDPALIRSGRLQYHFHLDYPKNQDIEDIIGLQLEEMGSLIDPSISATEICLSLIANENQRKYTCADIVGIGRRAKEMALREFIQKLYDEEKLSDNDTVFRIEMRHFLTF
jgi:SpoVK/Ycf46/Vps4 family AAA+-type ATPase